MPSRCRSGVVRNDDSSESGEPRGLLTAIDEQPFTRSLTGVEIPPHIEQVTVRAHHSEAGYDGRTQTVDLPN